MAALKVLTGRESGQWWAGREGCGWCDRVCSVRWWGGGGLWVLVGITRHEKEPSA